MSQQQTSLVKSFGFFTAFLLVAGSMIGSGVFKKVAPMTAELGSPWLVLLALLAAGLISLLGALTNAEVAGLIAEPGGQYAYFKKMYGKPFSFLYGWSMMSVVQTATAASVAYVFAESLNTLIELPRLGKEWEEITYGSGTFKFTPFYNLGVKTVTIGLLMILAMINYVGVKWGGWVLKILASSVIACIVIIILLCLSLGGGTIEHVNHAAVVTDATKHSGMGFVGAFFAAMMAAFWAYEGWNTVGFMGGEIKNPYKNIPRALTYGTLFVIGLYMLVNFAYVYVLPAENFIAIHNAENQIAAVEVVRSFLGGAGATFILVLIMMSTFNSTNTTIMGAPRIYYAMANDGLFFKGVAKIHPKYKTPSNALLIQGIWGAILVLSGNFDQLTDMLIFAAFIFYGAGAFGVFVLRRKLKDVPRPYKVFGYPFIPALFVIFCAALVIISVVTKPREAGIGVFLILTGIPVYFYMVREQLQAQQLIKLVKQTTLYTFLVGSLIFAAYYYSSSYEMLYFGYVYLVLAAFINTGIVLVLVKSKHKFTGKQLLQNLTVLGINLPIMAVYCAVACLIFVDTIRINLTNSLPTEITDVRINGKDALKIERLEPGQRQELWLPVNEQSSITIHYVSNGTEVETVIADSVNAGMGQKWNYRIGGENEEKLKRNY